MVPMGDLLMIKVLSVFLQKIGGGDRDRFRRVTEVFFFCSVQGRTAGNPGSITKMGDAALLSDPVIVWTAPD
ncbi:hypothetical protein EAQG_04783 [Escherichia coli TA464]|nr:hypothetical protein EAQG_04783 [Escherichia coli TA464]